MTIPVIYHHTMTQVQMGNLMLRIKEILEPEFQIRLLEGFPIEPSDYADFGDRDFFFDASRVSEISIWRARYPEDRFSIDVFNRLTSPELGQYIIDEIRRKLNEWLDR